MYLIGVQDSLRNVTYMSAVVDGPNPILIDPGYPTYTDITCNNLDNGTITIAATGETGSYFFDLAGPVTESNSTGNFAGLPAGAYTVTVRDADICTTSDISPEITINNPDPVTVTTVDINDAGCFGEFSGSIAIIPDGGTPSGSGTGYTYLWTGPSGFTSTDEDIINLEAGNYFVSITDGNGCSNMIGPYTVGQPSQISALLDNSTPVVCYGESNGTASITPGGGAGGYIYSWVGQANGLISNDQNPTNLPADVYDLTIEDGSGCSETFSPFLSISEPDPLSIQIVSFDPVTCNGNWDGSAQVTADGGTPSYSFSWIGATSGYTSTEEDPTGMPADVYTLNLSDINSCSNIFDDVLTITEPQAIDLTVENSSDVSCFGGSDGAVQATVTGGIPPYSFSWVCF